MQGCLIVTMDKFGMFILIVVNVQTICTGTVRNVRIFLCVMAEEYSMLHIIVYVRMDNFGMVKNVLIQVVLVDRFGMGPNVYVQLIETSMDQFVLNASMDKYGMLLLKCVNVQQALSGQVLVVRELIIVLETVSMIKSYSIVFVLRDSIGTEEVVLFSPFVLVEEYGM